MKLTSAFRNSSIRSRLTLLIGLNSGISLVLAGLGLFIYESVEQRETASRELSTEARILAGNGAFDLKLADPRSAMQTLSTLQSDSDILEAVMYNRDNHAFARYTREGVAAHSTEAPPWQDGIYIRNGTLSVFEPIMLRGERIGSIYLKTASDVGPRLHRYIGIVFLVLLLSLAITLLLGSGMQKTIVEPLAALSAIAWRVSVDKDYSVRATSDAGGEIGILVSSFNHMLSQIEAREVSLRESEERYALAARGANDGLWDWKFASDEVYFSPRFNQILGFPDAHQWSDPEDYFRNVHESDIGRAREAIALHLAGKAAEFIVEYRIRHNRGGYVWLLIRGIAVRDANGVPVRMAGSATDITAGKIADPLTRLPNRLYLIDKLESSLDEARRTGALFAVLFVDLDRFKLVNDSLGHAAGDELLTGVALRLKLAVREEERSGAIREFSVARLGGDEFAILLDNVDEAYAAIIAQRVVTELDAAFHICGRQVFATASIGIAMSSSGQTPEDILRNADTAMYHAKAQGKARFEVFDERMRERAVARLEIETNLRKATEAGQLLLHYQPEISIASRRVIGYEALVRWNHPERGLLSPGEFIPVAEESDLIVQLGRWVLREACRQMAQWHQTLAFDPPLTISVNVSARQLSEAGFVDDVERILAETGLDPRCLKLEMTESSIMGNPETTLATLRRLKCLNVRLEIDDFGTGYSSLSYLQKLPFDTVKVDRSFIRELGTGAESLEIVRTIVELARSLEMQVVAEGVETGDQLQRLTELGCNTVQGFYFSKPLSSQTTLALMLERKELEHAFETLQTPALQMPALQTSAFSSAGRRAPDTPVPMSKPDIGPALVAAVNPPHWASVTESIPEPT